MVQATNFIYDRVRETQHYYQYAKDLLATHFTNLYDKGVRMAVIYGTGQLAEIAYLSLLDSPLILYSILTDDSSKNKFLGHEVLTLPNFSQKISEIPNSESLIILSTVSQVENKILIIEIKKYKSLSQKIKIINIESILKDNQ
jgi:hypothetical protein